MVEAVQVQYGEGDMDEYMHLSLKPFALCAQHRQALGNKGGAVPGTERKPGICREEVRASCLHPQKASCRPKLGQIEAIS